MPTDARHVEYLVQRHVAAALAEQVKDRKVLEVETADAVNERVWKWAKFYASTVGTALSILAVVLGLFGIKSFADFRSALKSQQEAIERATEKVEAAKMRAIEVSAEISATSRSFDNSKADVERLAMDLPAVQQQLAALRRQAEVERTQLSDRIDAVENALGVALSSDDQRRLGEILMPYRAYLEDLGFGAARDPVTFHQAAEGTGLAFYIDSKLYFTPEALDEPTLIHREFTHHVLMQLFPREGRGVEVDPARAYPSALGGSVVSYLAASFNDEPKLLDLYDLDNGAPITASAIRQYAINPSPAIESIGGAMWAIREAVPRSVADRTFADAWRRLDPEIASEEGLAQVRAFFQAVLAAAPDAETRERMREVLAERGLEL